MIPGGAVGAKEDGMVKLVAVLMAWLGAHTPYSGDVALPEVRRAEPQRLQEMMYGDRAHVRALEVMALYDPDTATVWLSTAFDPKRVQHRGYLLHELVHHLQYANDAEFLCRPAREPEAYHFQEMWLEQQGAAFQHDWFTIFATSRCKMVY